MTTPEDQASALRAQDGYAEAFSDQTPEGAEMSSRGATYAAAYFMALADGKATDDELASIKRFVDLMAPRTGPEAPDSDEQIMLTIDAASASSDPDKFIARIVRALPEHKQRVVALLVAALTSLADGQVHDNERALIETLARAFGLDRNSVDHILESARGIATGPWAP
jgi:tellurite resistance protein